VRKMVYLLFCDDCGIPQHVPDYILEVYFPAKGVNNTYCQNCSNEMTIPEYLKKISPELVKKSKEKRG
jgi:hypothetical protein